MYAFQNTSLGTTRKNTRTICLGFAIIAVAWVAGIIRRRYASPMADGTTLTMSKYKKWTICLKRTLKVNHHIAYFTADEKTDASDESRLLWLLLFIVYIYLSKILNLKITETKWVFLVIFNFVLHYIIIIYDNTINKEIK